MMPSRRSRPLAMAIAGLLLSAPMLARAVDLTVEVVGAAGAQGTIDAALYDSPATWMKTPLQGQRATAADRAVLVYRGLAPGRYAVSLFQDANGNGRLDTNIAGVPTERYGFSRDARGLMGPPAFDDAALDLREDTTLVIHLR